MLTRLLFAGADVHAMTCLGETALMAACEEGVLQIAVLLAAFGSVDCRVLHLAFVVGVYIYINI